MEKTEGFVLVGGRSSRMGQDKSALTIGNQTFLERVAGAVASIYGTVRIVGGKEDSVTPFDRVPDIYPDWGALGGLHAALTACQSDWALVVACDLPFITADLLERLGELRAGFDAVAPIQEDGRPQPLCALYNVEICRRKATELIAAGERRPIALLQSVRTRWVAFNEVADLRGASHFFDNINTPYDYTRATLKEASS
jgi:molybdopterin-guanine dinucleotide biosynthesis protein A